MRSTGSELSILPLFDGVMESWLNVILSPIAGETRSSFVVEPLTVSEY